MLPENPTSSAPKKAVTPRHALLENLISLVNKHISEQFNELSIKWAGSLVDADEAVDVKTLQARLRAGNRLRTDHYAFLGIWQSNSRTTCVWRSRNWRLARRLQCAKWLTRCRWYPWRKWIPR